MKPVKLITERLILRRANDGDAGVLFENYFSNVESSIYLQRTPHTHVNQTHGVLKKWCDLYWDNQSNKFAWVVAFSDTNEAVGIFLVELDDESPQIPTAQIHFGISNNYSRQGLITEAGQKIIQWLLSHKNVTIKSVCDSSNIASIRVLEKLGFQKEKVLKKCLILPAFESPRDCCSFIFPKIL